MKKMFKKIMFLKERRIKKEIFKKERERCSTSSVTRETQIKATTKY